MEPDELRALLVDSGRLLPTAVAGLYGRDAAFEAVVAGVDAWVSAAAAADHPVAVHYPPLIPTTDFDRIGYLRNFPDLVGAVVSFRGGDAEHREVTRRLDDGEPYLDLLTQAEVSLSPACCYPFYAAVAGVLPAGGHTFETSTYCFRHEPSPDPMRLQAFRQREHVRIAEPDAVVEWRARWYDRAPQLLADLGLDVVADVANDPFFGRAGRLMQRSQREQQLKSEFLVNVYGDERRTACASLNLHQEHFAHLFGISTDDGADASSSCIGFGLERCAVALFARHGTDPAIWPSIVRTRLGL